MAATGMALTGNFIQKPIEPVNVKNKLPRWKGFNLLDYFGATPRKNIGASGTTEDDLKWMTDGGFYFVRLPMAYPRYLNFDRGGKITKFLKRENEV